MGSLTGGCRAYYLHCWASALLCFVACLSPATNAIDGNETDRLALLEFKARITEDPLKIMSSWNDTTHFCNWFGVTCSKRHQRVTQLNLHSSQLGGSISPHIGNLSFLRIVRLELKSLVDQIPSQMGSLSRLKILYLDNNLFVGRVPSLRKLSALNELTIYNNSLGTRGPDDLHFLCSLTNATDFLRLDIGKNNFGGSIPECIGNFSNTFRELWLNNNYITGSIPFGLANLVGLSIFCTNHNNITGKVPSLQKLTVLNQFRVYDNYLGTRGPDDLSFLCSFTNATDLQILDVSINHLGGSLPECIGNLSSKLREFWLDNNYISGNIPSGIGNLISLNVIRGETNFFSGNIPESLGNLSNLTVICLSSNNFHGNIPPSLGKCRMLQALSLQVNNLSGTLPPEVITRSLVLFAITMNNIHGRIPQSLCNATKLGNLDLMGNYFKGIIPSCLIAKTQTLSVLNLRDNKIGGTIPDEFGKGCLLEFLDLNGNFLRGKLPRSLGNCRRMKLIDVGNNQLNDVFPCELNTLFDLQILMLNSNQFSGTVACSGKESIWPMLQILDLAFNRFNGELNAQFISERRSMMVGTKEQKSKSDFLQSYSNIRYGVHYFDAIMLTLKGNAFELDKNPLKFFTSMDFSNNAFHGEIPKELGNLNGLICLNLSHNYLSGNIPSSFGNMNQLESLDLSCNSLDGNIPQEFGHLNFLQILNLSFNKLVGRIPTSTQLQSFDASSYQGNMGLYGPPLTPVSIPQSLPPPSLVGLQSQWNSESEVDWMLRGAEVGFPVGLTVFIGPLLYIKRWRRWYCKHLGRLAMKMLGREDQARGRRSNRKLQRPRH